MFLKYQNRQFEFKLNSAKQVKQVHREYKTVENKNFQFKINVYLSYSKITINLRIKY